MAGAPAGPVIIPALLGTVGWLVVAAAGARLAHRLPPAPATRLLVVGAVAAAGTVTATVGCAGGLPARRVRAVWRTRWPRHGMMHADRPIVLDHPAPLSTPHPAGWNVVTTGLVGNPDPIERQVLPAHETSHIRHGHARWATVAAAAAHRHRGGSR